MEKYTYKIMYENEKDHWWFKTRRELVKQILIGLKLKNPLILDAGCGTGLLSQEIRPFGEIYSVDFSDEAVEFCQKRQLSNLYQADIRSLPFEENKFDAVLLLDILEHTDSEDDFLREMGRVLKGGGVLVIFVPVFSFLWGVQDEISHHKRRYTKRQIEKILAKHGFDIVKSSYFNFFLFFPILFLRKFIKWFHIPIQSENNITTPLINKILYYLFRFEGYFLKYASFPWGVSLMSIARKTDRPNGEGP